MRYYIGIDPGKKGGVSIVKEDGNLVAVYRMPATVAKFNDLTTRICVDIDSNNGRGIAVIERAQAMPKQGVSSMFNYGRHCGELVGVLTAHNLPLHEVRPQEWKKVVLAGEGDKKSKDTSIRVAEKIFPSIELTPDRCIKPQDGMAEAALIAEYGRRKNL